MSKEKTNLPALYQTVHSVVVPTGYNIEAVVELECNAIVLRNGRHKVWIEAEQIDLTIKAMRRAQRELKR